MHDLHYEDVPGSPAMTLPDGVQLRDQGISRAVIHAEDKTPGWSEMALEHLRRYLQAHPGETFLAEQVRLWSHNQGLPRPPHARAWGGVLAAAKHRRLIVCVGTAQVNNAKAHKCYASLWKAA